MLDLPEPDSPEPDCPSQWRWAQWTLFVHAVSAQNTGDATPANSHWYLGTYSHDILVWDEESEEVIDRIKMRNFIPRGLSLNHARDRLYVADATAKHYEVVDLATHEVVDEFTLSRGNVSVRISSFAPSPDDRRAVLFVKRYTKLRDRYSVEGPFILEYDLTTKEVTDTIPFPDGQEREGRGPFSTRHDRQDPLLLHQRHHRG